MSTVEKERKKVFSAVERGRYTIEKENYLRDSTVLGMLKSLADPKTSPDDYEQILKSMHYVFSSTKDIVSEEGLSELKAEDIEKYIK